METSPRKIFITGAGSGIGAATAKLFVKKGWRVCAFDISEENLIELKHTLPDNSLEIIQGDVCDAEAVENALVTFCGDENGTLDVLLNNAGIMEVGPFEDIGIEANKKIVDVNLNGVLICTDRALPFLKRANSAHIINMSSASSLYGNPELTIYAATKSAVRSLTEGWSIAMEKYGIHVCDIAPMYVRGPMLDAHHQGFRKLEIDEIKLTAGDVAQTIYQATQHKKLHWYVGRDTMVFSYLKGLIPQALARRIVKKVIGYN